DARARRRPCAWTPRALVRCGARAIGLRAFAVGAAQRESQTLPRIDLGCGRLRAMSACPDACRFLMCAGVAAAVSGCTTMRGCRRGPAREPVTQATATQAAATRAEPQEQTRSCPASLIAARRGGTEQGRYVAPSDEERAAMTKLVARLISEGEPALPEAR